MTHSEFDNFRADVVRPLREFLKEHQIKTTKVQGAIIPIDDIYFEPPGLNIVSAGI